MTDISSAIRAICEEKGLSYESVLSTIEASLAAAYRKDYGQKNQNIKVEFDPKTSNSKVFDVKTVVEDLPEEENTEEEEEVKGSGKETEKKEKEKESSQKNNKTVADEEQENKKDNTEEDPEQEERRFNPKTEIQLSDAKMIKEDAEAGEEIKTELDVPDSYGRMAAQTAKQVIIQKLREAERETIFNEFKEKEHEVVGGVVQRREARRVLVDLGRAVGNLYAEDQVYGEKYNPGERIKVYIKEVRMGNKGPEVILSRTSEEILKKIFYLEIPEVSNGLIEIKGVAREAGSRSKVAIWTDSENVDPIGSCVGQRGGRIQTIINELGGERVDIIEYEEDPVKFITNALSPAKVLSVELDEEKEKAIVRVSPDQLSLAIGKRGQNVRLTARLTGWKIDIVEEKEDVDKEEKRVFSSDDNMEKFSEEKTVEKEKENNKKEEQEKEESGSSTEETKNKKDK